MSELRGLGVALEAGMGNSLEYGEPLNARRSCQQVGAKQQLVQLGFPAIQAKTSHQTYQVRNLMEEPWMIN